MARRYNSYWVTEKWVYDRAARRRAMKAHAALDGVERYLMEHGPDPFDLIKGRVDFAEELAYEDAFGILTAARAAIEAEEKAAHAAAKART